MALVKASHRYARISATKVRPFTDMISGKPAGQALNELRYVPNRGARFLEKVVRSAMANAEDKQARNVEGLKIVEARVDQGPMVKRIRPRARGMAFVVRSRMAHIHITLEAPGL
ncbi:MAG: 50S ribosomal protein L22 [Planctomycetaceae bacterium]|nr:50S ribosomal protein L22 [Planctomycetaceae bacterium]